jgi:hypothetical protein
MPEKGGDAPNKRKRKRKRKRKNPLIVNVVLERYL